jgi:hypothetical protein
VVYRLKECQDPGRLELRKQGTDLSEGERRTHVVEGCMGDALYRREAEVILDRRSVDRERRVKFRESCGLVPIHCHRRSVHIGVYTSITPTHPILLRSSRVYASGSAAYMVLAAPTSAQPQAQREGVVQRRLAGCSRTGVRHVPARAAYAAACHSTSRSSTGQPSRSLGGRGLRRARGLGSEVF